MKTYTIFQLKDKYSEYLFQSYANVRTLRVSRAEYYNQIYTGNMSGMSLEDIFMKFNIEELPEDFRGHSLSISDVIVINDYENSCTKAYYVDTVGFQELPYFFSEKDEPELFALLYKHEGEDDFEIYMPDLPTEDLNAIRDILMKSAHKGYSVRGTAKDMAQEIWFMKGE